MLALLKFVVVNGLLRNPLPSMMLVAPIFG